MEIDTGAKPKPPDREKIEAFVHEGVVKADEILALFPKDTRGMMQFMAAMEGLRRFYPGLFKRIDPGEGLRLIAHWFMAGEPEDPGSVPQQLLKRYGPNAFRKVEETYIPPEGKK